MRGILIGVLSLWLVISASSYGQQPTSTTKTTTRDDENPSGRKHRKGFVIGLGLGPGYTTYKFDVAGYGSTKSQDKFGVSSDFKIGYAPSDQVIICWMSKVAWYSEEMMDYSYYYGITTKDITVANGVGAVGVCYFFRPWAPSPYIFGGLGYSSFSTPFDNYKSSTGFGLTLGGGIEFARHWCIEGSLVYGNPSDAGVTMKSTSLKVTLNWLGY